MQGSTSQVDQPKSKADLVYKAIPQAHRNPIDVTNAKHKAMVFLKAYQEQHGLSQRDIAKALNYNEQYVFQKLKKLSAVEFVNPSEIKTAFKTLKHFSAGKAVNRIKPKDKTVLSAALEVIKIGTDHNDNQSNPQSLTLNLNVLRGLEPTAIAVDSLDDRQLIDACDTVVIKDMCIPKVKGIQDLKNDSSDCFDFLE